MLARVEPASAAGETVLGARGLSKEFRGYVAVSGVDLDVRSGTIHALIGPNGAGKTTVFNLLTKFIAPSSGSISFDGMDVTHERPAALARRGLIRSFQISAVFPHLSVRDNVRMRCSAVSFRRCCSGAAGPSPPSSTRKSMAC
jgi:branched-chain amino acid transport system ATP-binding protein